MTQMPLRGGDPSRIGRYRLTARLGAGGMGVVYLGSAKDGSQVAVKVLRPELADDHDFRARFRREVAMLTRVHGLCTVRLIEADTESDKPFLATEYVDGPSLAEQMGRSGPFGPGMVHGLATGLAEALVSIHAAGVIHRDLKPGNVLLTQAGPKVIDFGIAQAMDATAMTRTGMTVGSPGFMAPEQIMGQAGRPADVFSWGLTVAYAASGQPPFGTGPTEAVMYRIIHDNPDIAAVPAGLRPLVAAALAKNPNERPTAGDLLGHLTRGTDGAVAATAAADAPTQIVLSRTWLLPVAPAAQYPLGARRASRQRVLLLLAGAAALAVVVGVAAAFLAAAPGRPSAGPPATQTASPASSVLRSAPSTPSASEAATTALPIVTIGSYSGRKPAMIGVSGDSGNVVQDIDWTSWTATSATGDGTSGWDNCVPNCASGTMTQVPTEVNFSAPVHGRFTQMREVRDGSAVFMTYKNADWPLSADQAGTPACPTSGQLMTAWQSASASVQQSWAAPGTIDSFDYIQCWDDWVVAGAVGNGNGTVVFSQSGGLHVFPELDLQQFSDAVCPNPQAPNSWKNPSSGPATC
jgi:predicted Ser/Thr protein kinase